MRVGPTIDELVVADEPDAWERVGFAVADGCARVGTVRLRFAGREAGQGLIGWSLRELAATDLDGLATTRSTAAPAEPGRHPNGAVRIDHVVVLTPDLDRTFGAFEAAGIELRRLRDAGTPERPLRQGFFRLGEVILEVVGGAPDADGRASFWGLVFVVEDIDALADQLGEQLGSVKAAVQPGRRIATVRSSAGLGVPVAFMTPERPRAAVPGARRPARRGRGSHPA
jgi:hypothetical protein